MTDINIKTSAEITEEEKKKLAKRQYMREYMAKKYADPEYREKIKKINRESKAKRWNENPELRAKAYEKNNAYYHKYKDIHKQARLQMEMV